MLCCDEEWRVLAGCVRERECQEEVEEEEEEERKRRRRRRKRERGVLQCGEEHVLVVPCGVNLNVD